MKNKTKYKEKKLRENITIFQKVFEYLKISQNLLDLINIL